MSTYKGIVLVGGSSVGTRFRPLNMDYPKPLFPVAGHAIIYHHVAALAKIPGMKEIYLIGFFEQNCFDGFLREIQAEFSGVKIRYLREYQSMGTAGGLHHFRDEILKGNPDSFFVLNGDIASSFPLMGMLSTHKKAAGVATILSIRMEKKKLNRYGCVVVDEATLQVQHFVEKPESFVSDLISCGVYLFNKEVFSFIQTAAETRAIFEEENVIDISQFEYKKELAASNAALLKSASRVQLEQDLLPLLAAGRNCYAHIMGQDDFWMAIKTGSNTITANKLYLQYFMQTHPRLLTPMSPSFPKTPLTQEPGTPASQRTHPEIVSPVVIHATAVIHPSAKIGPNVFIGPNVLIGRGVRVRDALILDGVEIKQEACVIQAIIGWESKVGCWSRIEGSATSGEDKEAATQKGMKLPSASILGKGVVVADEVIIRDCIVLPHKELRESYHREILM